MAPSRTNTSSSSSRTYNSSASGSQSPASEGSSNTSPPSRTSQLPMKKETDTQSSGSGRGTPNRTRIDMPRNLSAAKGGCWTCRLRRKKCDEQREEEGGACETCRRLHIECLGWGSKRPEWMKDKKAQDEYKARIKATLLSNNMIRGQPRTTVQQANANVNSNTNTNTNTQPVSAPPPGPSQTFPSRPSSSTNPAPRRAPSNVNGQSVEYRYGDLRHSRQSSSGDNTAAQGSNLPQRRSYHGSQTTYEPTTTSPSNYYLLPPASYSDSSLGTLDLHSTFSPAGLGATPDTAPFDAFSFVGPSFTYDTQPHTFSSGQNSVQQEHVLYYFEHVRKMQFIFASNNVTNITYAIILQEPQGPVTSAVCALASLHNERMRVAQGLETHESNPDSYAQFFYNEAWSRLANSKQSRGQYTVADAIAALHLVSYSILSRGATDWRIMLDVACDWLGRLGIASNENPKYMLSTMTSAETFALKTTMWYDIVSSVTLMRPPRYLALYRRLFGSISAYWPCTGQTPEEAFDLRMDSLAGCPDEVMLGIAEVSALAHWKAQEQQNGSLSMRELIRRGDVIEQQLRAAHANTGPDFFSEIDQAPLHPSLPGAAGVDYNAVSPTAMHAHASSSPQLSHTIVPFPTEDMRRLVAEIFREAVILYLHMVLSDPVPGVPEISASVDTIIQLFTQLPSSEVDRSLVLPLCLAGCLTTDRSRRDLVKARLQAQDENIGNIFQVRGLVEAVWRQRDFCVGAGMVVDWRDVIRNEGVNVLLI